MLNIKVKNTIRVRMLIGKQEKSLREFANNIGISHPYLSQILNGKRNPSPAVAYKIANGLKVNFEEIFLITNVAKDNQKEVKQ